MAIKESKNNKLEDWQSSLLEKSGLTSRELDIAYLILQDMTYLEIANEMIIAEGTVSKHGSNIYKKTGSGNKRTFIKRFSRKIEVLEGDIQSFENQ